MTVQAAAELKTTGEPISFVCEGATLAGSLHRPARLNGKLPGVVLLNQGPLDRSGAHRFYVKLAWRLTALGFVVLRFDARAVGESQGAWEGESDAVSILDIYGSIQRGAWVADARAAIEFMKRTVGSKHLLLGGMCGGSITALLAGSDHPDVAGMFVVGTPITFSSVTRRVADLPEAIIQRDTRQYFKKLVDPRSWARFLSFQTDYRTLVGVFATQVRRRLKGSVSPGESVSSEDPNVNGAVVRSFTLAPERGKRLLVVYGENDFLWHEFQEHVGTAADRARLPFQLLTIPDANHTLTDEGWQATFFHSLGDWLEHWTAADKRSTKS